jgi:hypothetical protein
MAQHGRSNYEAVTGSKLILFIFLTFGRDTTNYRGTLVENVKKSKFNPPYWPTPALRPNTNHAENSGL